MEERDRYRFNLRISEKDYDYLKKKSQKLKFKNMTDFVRHAVDHMEVVELPIFGDAAELDKLREANSQIVEIASQVNRMTKLLNSTHKESVLLYNTKQMQELLPKVIDLQKEVLFMSGDFYERYKAYLDGK